MAMPALVDRQDRKASLHRARDNSGDAPPRSQDTPGFVGTPPVHLRRRSIRCDTSPRLGQFDERIGGNVLRIESHELQVI